MVTESVDAGLVEVAAGHQRGGEVVGAVDVVVAVAIPGAADPAVLNFLGMQGAEGVDETAIVSELPVEVVLEGGEEFVARLVVRFEDVEITEEDRELRVFAGGEGGGAGGPPFPLPRGFLEAGIAGGGRRHR